MSGRGRNATGSSVQPFGRDRWAVAGIVLFVTSSMLAGVAIARQPDSPVAAELDEPVAILRRHPAK
ncbi:MAG: hypothetical protein EOP66_03980, partial [Sphingomonas sp.]